MSAVPPIQFETAQTRHTPTHHQPLHKTEIANYYLSTALNQVSEGVLILHPNPRNSQYKVIYSNSYMTQLTGANPLQGMRGTNLQDLLINQTDYDSLTQALRHAHHNGGSSEWSGTIKNAYGQHHQNSTWRIRAVQNDFGQLQNYTLTITPTKTTKTNSSSGDPKLDSQRNRNDQLATMSRGVMHDLNHLLAIIMANLSYITEVENENQSQQTLQHIKEALEATEQAREFTAQTLSLAKDVPPTKEPINFANLIKTATRIAQSGSGVNLHSHVDSDLWWINGDRPCIAQVVQNLVINGIQAMNNTGKMDVLACNVNAPEGHSIISQGPHVQVLVRDRGCGMPPDVLTRVMQEPYTTKPNGNGIGLATCRRVIEEHGGKMHISSMSGVGTEVYFWLPAIPPPTPQEEPQTEQKPKTPSPQKHTNTLTPGVGSILVVDDEPRLRQIIVTVLIKCGYQVYEAEGGIEAIDTYRRLMRQNEEVDLVIMDLTLKNGLNGVETLHKIKELNPSAKVIVSSGELVPQNKSDYLDLGFCDILPKPYMASNISKLVHQYVMQPQKN